jgi:hypothetical protein
MRDYLHNKHSHNSFIHIFHVKVSIYGNSAWLRYLNRHGSYLRREALPIGLCIYAFMGPITLARTPLLSLGYIAVKCS